MDGTDSGMCDVAPVGHLGVDRILILSHGRWHSSRFFSFLLFADERLWFFCSFRFCFCSDEDLLPSALIVSDCSSVNKSRVIIILGCDV